MALLEINEIQARARKALRNAKLFKKATIIGLLGLAIAANFQNCSVSFLSASPQFFQSRI